MCLAVENVEALTRIIVIGRDALLMLPPLL
jgi:hypothetical protein